jgi:hypothetical protein
MQQKTNDKPKRVALSATTLSIRNGCCIGSDKFTTPRSISSSSGGSVSSGAKLTTQHHLLPAESRKAGGRRGFLERVFGRRAPSRDLSIALAREGLAELYVGDGAEYHGKRDQLEAAIAAAHAERRGICSISDKNRVSAAEFKRNGAWSAPFAEKKKRQFETGNAIVWGSNPCPPWRRIRALGPDNFEQGEAEGHNRARQVPKTWEMWFRLHGRRRVKIVFSASYYSIARVPSRGFFQLCSYLCHPIEY